MILMMHFSLILHHNMCMKYAEEPCNMGMFVFTNGVLQNGYIFRPPTHTSGHFYTGVAPPPTPGPKL